MSLQQLASALGNTKSSVRKKLGRLGIKKKSYPPSRWTARAERSLLRCQSSLTYRQLGRKFGVTPPAIQRKLERMGVKKERVKDSAALRRVWKLPKKKTKRFIAAVRRIIRRVNRLGLAPTRLALTRLRRRLWRDPTSAYNQPEYAKKLSGKNSANWKGGVSFEPYPSEFNDALRRKIKQRDGHKCVLCSRLRRLSVHHIDHVKTNSSATNLVTLCVWCHSKETQNRKRYEPRIRRALRKILKAS